MITNLQYKIPCSYRCNARPNLVPFGSTLRYCWIIVSYCIIFLVMSNNNANEEVDKQVLRKYEISQKIGKGVSDN